MKTQGYEHGRWCKGCNQHHGILYLCPKYPEDLKEHIRKGQASYVANLSDPAWVQKAIDDGLPPVAVMCFRAMAGL